MHTERYPLDPPSLAVIASALAPHLAKNYVSSSIAVVSCPDLRAAPFGLTTQGLGGSPRVAEVGGQSNLFPNPQKDASWSFPDLAREMEMSGPGYEGGGNLIGAGAGPWRDVGQNSELAADYSWSSSLGSSAKDQDTAKSGEESNNSRCVLVNKNTSEVEVRKAPAPACALMCNLFGSQGRPGDVLKITARSRAGDKASFTECIQEALSSAFSDHDTPVSIGGVVLIKPSTRAKYHVMPDFPSESELPFKDVDAVTKWLTWHDYSGPIIGLSVIHSSDPGEEIGLRLEHTHTFSPTGEHAGGHYHYDLEEGKENVEYEAYYNVAEVVYRIDRVAQ